jgi:hypothetical protein
VPPSLSISLSLPPSLSDECPPQVATMEEMKHFKTSIHTTNWDISCLDFRCKETLNKTRFYQLLWVTKDLQATIKGGDEGRKAAENATLEKQMQHLKSCTTSRSRI